MSLSIKNLHKSSSMTREMTISREEYSIDCRNISVFVTIHWPSGHTARDNRRNKCTFAFYKTIKPKSKN